jgi:hypothetical protein
MMIKDLALSIVLGASLAYGCADSSTGSLPDASVDASTDAAADAATDASVDGGEDAGMDSGVPGRRVFVSSAVQNADFGGIAGADELCATEAAAAGLDGVFKAWLSTRSSSVADRLEHSTEPYMLVDGTVVAVDWDDLVDGALLARIGRDATGQPHTDDVWTGTLATGASYAIDDCEGFTSGSTGQSQCGSSTSTTMTWTQAQTPECATRLRLYCFEQR